MSFSFNIEDRLESEVFSLKPTNDIELAIKKTEYHDSIRLLGEHLKEGGQISVDDYRIPIESLDSGEYNQERNN